MKYLVLLMGDGDEPDWSTMSDEQQAAAMQRHADFDTACAARDGVELLGGEALEGPDAATTVRIRDGVRSITEGPYAEVIEGLGGFYLVEAPDLDVVLELVTALPAYDLQIVPVSDLE